VTNLLTALTLLLSAMPGTAQGAPLATLTLAEESAAALGITTELPGPAASAGVARATARVVVPPAGLRSAGTMYAGVVVQLLAGAGEQVAAGQVLAELTSPEFLAAQRDLVEAAAQATLAASSLARDQRLLEAGIIAERRVQETRARARIAAAQLAQARELLLQSGVEPAALNAVEAKGTLIPRVSVTAPAGGVVLGCDAGVGDPLPALAEVCRVADLHRLWVEISLSRQDAARVRPGMRFQVLDTPGSPAGTITLIGRGVDGTSQTLSVRGELDGADAGLRPDEFVTVEIGDDDATAGELLSVPSRALVRHRDATVVFVRQPDGVEVRAVALAGASGDRINVRSGLTPQDAVVVSGIAALKALWLTQEAE
jgi:RND family efflux transporter MFP subunit